MIYSATKSSSECDMINLTSCVHQNDDDDDDDDDNHDDDDDDDDDYDATKSEDVLYKSNLHTV